VVEQSDKNGLIEMAESTHILIVDDNPAMADTLADILEAKGFSVHAALSAAQALQILKQAPVDILLTDIKMPEMNGLELYRATRKSYPNLITIFMTAYAADELIQQGMAEGVKTVLTKPLDIKFLLLLFSAEKRIIDRAG
jgi:CheY-like chemotaxis protein